MQSTLSSPVDLHRQPNPNGAGDTAYAILSNCEELTPFTDSSFGAHCLAINLSLLHTAKCLQRDPIPLLKTLLLGGSDAAADFLFNNSS